MQSKNEEQIKGLQFIKDIIEGFANELRTINYELTTNKGSSLVSHGWICGYISTGYTVDIRDMNKKNLDTQDAYTNPSFYPVRFVKEDAQTICKHVKNMDGKHPVMIFYKDWFEQRKVIVEKSFNKWTAALKKGLEKHQ